jgi:hypothetical protein
MAIHNPVRPCSPTRPRLMFPALAAWLVALAFLTLAPCAGAQQEAGEIPLGDVARMMRKKAAAAETVIDNDNLTKVMENADKQRAAGSPVFSLDPGGKSFRVSSPDVMCSLSFTAKSSSLLTDPQMWDELPRSELVKLDGPATIDGDLLQVSMHNGSAWEVREVTIGLTILKRADTANAAYYGRARVVPAVAGDAPQQESTKQPDVTLLMRVKGTAAPSTTAVFRTSLNFALFPDQEWHWAIVKAKGIPPQVPAQTTTATTPQ